MSSAWARADRRRRGQYGIGIAKQFSCAPINFTFQYAVARNPAIVGAVQANMLEEMLRAETVSAMCISKPSSAYPDIGHPLLRRIESRDPTRTESRTESWLESSVELKLEPRACLESESGMVPRSEIRAGLLNPNLLSPRSVSELKARLRSKSKCHLFESCQPAVETPASSPLDRFYSPLDTFFIANGLYNGRALTPGAGASRACRQTLLLSSTIWHSQRSPKPE
ncbi:hypothetical protein EVAR_48681_1 [Eumeta japonica]|uniref:Uncharacterized protein n=1 Tax=Eumeta variegata TaxID=151549 RepID=A0A4C1X9Z7_EUMVA|nr:hypothetical protein EVAR_48681_1 [Eumeta japonica]